MMRIALVRYRQNERSCAYKAVSIRAEALERNVHPDPGIRRMKRNEMK